MRKASGWIAPLLAVLALPLPAVAQPRQGVQTVECQPGTGAARRDGPSERARGYDVILEVPDLCVRRIRLKVDNLEAHLKLDARVANLVRVQAGADVFIGTVDLGIDGVRAEVLLLVDLDNVVGIVDNALSFIDNNPQIVSQLVGTVQNTVRTVGGVANTALQPGGVASQAVGAVGQTLENVTAPGGLLSQTVNTLGQTVQRTVDQTGSIVERTLDTAGGVVNQRTVGSLLSLPVVREATNAAGQAVRQVRDQTGALVEYTLDQAGRIVATRVVQAAARPR
ncbi:MAG TPA: hypothetical protein VFX98_10845 [Longimicrobiaceae bacterium]|nr:hypothetical protein [Longimicrobiaceae bacterium]